MIILFFLALPGSSDHTHRSNNRKQHCQQYFEEKEKAMTPPKSEIIVNKTRIQDADGFVGTVRYIGPVASAKKQTEIYAGIECKYTYHNIFI